MTDYLSVDPLHVYRERYAEHARISRSNGIVEVQMHTAGRSAMWSLELHNALPRLFRDIANDRANEVLILTGTGDHWLAGWDEQSIESIETGDHEFGLASYERWFRDGSMLQEEILGLDIPTIGVVNGPGFHTEFALLCDLTLCARDVVFFDGHFSKGVVPGDGLLLVLQELLGTKRAAYVALCRAGVTAEAAQECGLVNEVVSRSDLLDRARQHASRIRDLPEIQRRLTTHVARRRWNVRFAADFRLHFGYEMWGAQTVRGRHAYTIPPIVR